MSLPDTTGHFGRFGGRYVSETLMPALLELEEAYNHYRDDKEFKEEFGKKSKEIWKTFCLWTAYYAAT